MKEPKKIAVKTAEVVSKPITGAMKTHKVVTRVSLSAAPWDKKEEEKSDEDSSNGG